MTGTSTTTASVPNGTTVTEASAPDSNAVVVEAQGLTEISEADLMGFDSDAPEKTPATSESSASDESTTKPAEEKPTEKKPAEEKPAETDPEGDPPAKPPKGFVPLGAVKEVRSENKYLKDQLAVLTAALAAKSAPEQPKETVPSKFDDFKELGETEFNALAEESPKDALLYMKKLGQFQQHQLQESQAKKAAEDQELYLEHVVYTASQEMEKVVPGIFEPESEAASQFRDFAIDIGFNEELFFLTNPATKVIIAGETEPVLLGEQAAQIIKMLAQARTKLTAVKETAPVDVEKLKSDLRAEIEAEVLAKIKTGQSFRSMSAVPASESDRQAFAGKVLSEAEFEKLTSKEQDAYLAGE